LDSSIGIVEKTTVDEQSMAAKHTHAASVLFIDTEEKSCVYRTRLRVYNFFPHTSLDKAFL